MIADLRPRANLGKRVALVAEPAAVGEVTLDLRHEQQRPPLAHVSLYVRWLPGGPRPIGQWFGAAGPDLVNLVEVAS